MDWTKMYAEKVMSAREAVDATVKDGDTVSLCGLAIAPVPMEALLDKIREGALKNIALDGNLITSPLPLDDPYFTEDKMRYKCYFLGGYERKGCRSGSTTFVPLQFAHYRKYILEKVKPDVGVINVTPPDEEGFCNIGPLGAGFSPAVIESADRLIAQVNHNIPWAYGDNGLNVHISKINAVVEADTPIPEYPMAEITETDKKIADHIIDLIPDGATIQLGLGSMGNAIGYGLKDKKNLGVHSEMFTESMAYLHKKGVITNSAKTFMPGVSVAGFTLGSKEHYDFCRENKLLHFAPYSFTNNIANIAKNNKMISVNSAINMDVTGQLNSSSIGFRSFSGTGGNSDFVRGASASEGGKSFIAMTSTLEKKGQLISRIVLDLPEGTPVDTLRTDIQHVVTEYGCVNIFGDDIPTRVKKMISIAHPAFRERLEFDAKQKGLLY